MFLCSVLNCFPSIHIYQLALVNQRTFEVRSGRAYVQRHYVPYVCGTVNIDLNTYIHVSVIYEYLVAAPMWSRGRMSHNIICFV